MKPRFLVSLLCSFIFCAQAQQATPGAAARPKFSAVKDLGLTSAQAGNLADTTWAALGILEKINKAIETYPDSEEPKIYLGRYLMLNGDVAKAETILKPLADLRAHYYLLQGCMERKDDKGFVALYDARSACNMPAARDHRLQIAMQAKDVKRASECLEECERSYPENYIGKIVTLGVEYNQQAWAYEQLGKLAVRIPADEHGQKLLNRIFGEREKLKLLFPDQIK